MNTEVYRDSFLTAILDSAEERSHSVAEQLSQAGYRCETFVSYDELEKSFDSHPPHFLILSFDDESFELEAAIESLRLSLPETHIFLLSPTESLAEALKFYELGIFDCLALPLESPVQLIKAIDRAARLNFYYYESEQLSQKINEKISEPALEDIAQEHEMPPELPRRIAQEEIAEFEQRRVSKDRLPDFRSWLELLYSQPRQDLSIQAFFTGLKQLGDGFKSVYFKYIPQRRTLMASSWYNYDDKIVKSIGLNFNELSPNFRSEDLREPQSVTLLQELAMMVFKADEFRWHCLSVLGEVQGLFLFVPDADSKKSVDWDLLESYVSALQRHTELLELEKRLHSNSLRDPGTDVLNRHTLLRQVSEEVSRARRVQLPTSLVLISLDQYYDLKNQLGSEEVEVLLRALARIFIKHSRVNDVIGRVSSDQFALVLPHTSKEGAMIKAERVRKIIEAADFSKIIKSVGRLTVSLAVCEYPSLCRDAEELLHSADEALFQLKSETANKIIQVKVADDFVPDFEVEPPAAARPQSKAHSERL